MYTQPSSNTERKLADVLLNILREYACGIRSRDTISLTTRLIELGFDSLDAVEVLMELENHLDCEILDADAEWPGYEQLTVQDYARELATKLAARGTSFTFPKPPTA